MMRPPPIFTLFPPRRPSDPHGIGLGPGTGSPPSAISTPVLLHPQAACLRLAFFDVRACTTLGKTATAANKPDRKSTRLNSSHSQISYAVLCLKKKKSYILHT